MPAVSDPHLKKLIRAIYKAHLDPEREGQGKKGDAVRRERTTGEPTKNVFHSQAAEDLVTALKKALDRKRIPPLSKDDAEVARAELDDLEDALTHPLGRGVVAANIYNSAAGRRANLVTGLRR